MIIWQNETMFAVVTTDSNNRKTSNMAQIWIMSKKYAPKALRLTVDGDSPDRHSTCEGCILAGSNGCYVTNQPLASIFKKWQKGGYGVLQDEFVEEFFRGKAVRFGAFGNPSVLPIDLVARIVSVASKHTGYFHNWHLMKPETAKQYGAFFMASCEPSNRAKAAKLGLRTFTTYTKGSAEKRAYEDGTREIVCPNVTSNISCKECGLCDGTSRATWLPSIAIEVHGYQTKKAATAISK